MRPPSYYTSLANSNPTTSSNYRSSNSTSSQFRSTFAASPAYNQSSSAYVTRTHLPYVSQTMLVAHCITGVGSSTRPYGIQQSTSPFAYATSSTSNSNSSYRPTSTKNRHSNPYLNSSSSSSSSRSSYSPSSSSYRTSSASSSNSVSYLSPYSTHSSSSSYSPSSSYRASNYRSSNHSSTRPALSSYYQPIRLRERPLLTQISRQLNFGIQQQHTSSTKSGTLAGQPDETKTNQESTSSSLNEKNDVISKSLGVQRKEDDETWSSDVARNISRNKYLIKFREFDKRASISPIPPPSVEELSSTSNTIPEGERTTTTTLATSLEVVRPTKELQLIDSFDIHTVGGEKVVTKEGPLKGATTELKKPVKKLKEPVRNKKVSNLNNITKESEQQKLEDKMRIPIASKLLSESAAPVIHAAAGPIDKKASCDVTNNLSKPKRAVVNSKEDKALVGKKIIDKANETSKSFVQPITGDKKVLGDNKQQTSNNKTIQLDNTGKLLNCDNKTVITITKQADIFKQKETKPVVDLVSDERESKLKLPKEKKNIKLKIKTINNNDMQINQNLLDNSKTAPPAPPLTTTTTTINSTKNTTATGDKKADKVLKPPVVFEKPQPEVLKENKIIKNDKTPPKDNTPKAIPKQTIEAAKEQHQEKPKVDNTSTATTTTTMSKPKVKKLVKSGSKTKLTSDNSDGKEQKPKRKVLARKQSEEKSSKLEKTDKDNIGPSQNEKMIDKGSTKQASINNVDMVTPTNIDQSSNNNLIICQTSLTLPTPPTPTNNNDNTNSILINPEQKNKRIRFRNYHLEDFNFLSVLGHGGWGFVMLAELKEHDACFAVKCIKKITIIEDDDFDSIMIERKVLALGNVHPFICKLFCTFETDGYLFFVMEYCAGGDLMFHVQREGKFTESRCRFYAAEIICAIRFLHNRHIIYRDLKLDNILLDSKGHIRLVDFGMCQCRTYREEMLPSNFCGTPEYISPEIIKGVPYNHSVDWWSFGVLLYEMAVGKMPFRGNDENELLWNVCYEQIHYPMFLTRELTNLLQLLLEREPTKRMGMSTCKSGDIYDQAWFRGVDWASFEEMRVPPPFVPEVTSKRDVQNFDADFTESAPVLSPVDEGTLKRIDQNQFEKFPYTNPDIAIFESF